MNDNNVTQEKIMKIAQEQERLYSGGLNYILKNKSEFLRKSRVYDSEIFALEKIIKFPEISTYFLADDLVNLLSYIVCILPWSILRYFTYPVIIRSSKVVQTYKCAKLNAKRYISSIG